VPRPPFAILADVSHAKEAKMSNPPPDQHASRNGGDYPSAEQIERMASAFEAYARSEETASGRQTKHNRKIRRWTRVATFGAIAYTLITAGILVLTIRSVQEAGRAADAASRQANISSDTAKKQLRAYVFVDSIGIREISNPAGPETWVNIKNSGLTPAYGLFHDNWYIIGEYPLKHPLPVITPLRVSASSNYSFSELGPGVTHYKIRRHAFVTPLEIARLSAGASVIYFYGLVTFTDAFGCHRWMRYKSVLGGPVANRGLDNMVITDDGNDASDETAADCLSKAPQ
jgi:hypothetical protein